MSRSYGKPWNNWNQDGQDGQWGQRNNRQYNGSRRNDSEVDICAVLDSVASRSQNQARLASLGPLLSAAGFGASQQGGPPLMPQPFSNVQAAPMGLQVHMPPGHTQLMGAPAFYPQGQPCLLPPGTLMPPSSQPLPFFQGQAYPPQFGGQPPQQELQPNGALNMIGSLLSKAGMKMVDGFSTAAGISQPASGQAPPSPSADFGTEETEALMQLIKLAEAKPEELKKPAKQTAATSKKLKDLTSENANLKKLLAEALRAKLSDESSSAEEAEAPGLAEAEGPSESAPVASGAGATPGKDWLTKLLEKGKALQAADKAAAGPQAKRRKKD
mmetsp:Transcript_35801/g.64968  ORF Transcript_35801/g.64968 Transcript_35801/m.64968 type:complete len:328 (+) Transcript_35801:39-1022(+)